MHESSLAKEIFEVQQADNLPGLVNECKSLIKKLKLPDIFEEKVNSGLSKLTWKRLVNRAIVKYEESNLRNIISEKSKLKDGPLSSESFEPKEYISRLNLSKSRVKFLLRSKMLDAKFNYSAKYENELWQCDSCCSAIETQSHLVFCPAYARLREGKNLNNDEHLIEYIQKVMDIRTKLNLRK